MDISGFLDNPMFTQVAFHPRPAYKGSSHIPGTIDGSLPVEEGVKLGWRCFPAKAASTPAKVASKPATAEAAPSAPSSKESAATARACDADSTPSAAASCEAEEGVAPAGPSQAASPAVDASGEAPPPPPRPVVLLWHGNGEIAADYDHMAGLWTDARGEAFPNVNLLVVDFAGYGWSTGMPGISTLARHGAAVAKRLPQLLKSAGIHPEAPLFVLGRSIGSVAAVAMVAARPAPVAGLILDAGIAQLFTLPMAQQLVQAMPQVKPLLSSGMLADPFNNAGTLSKVHTPLLVLHGDSDRIVPVDHGQANFDASAAPAEHKTLKIWEGTGHNDTLMRYLPQFFQTVSQFVRKYASGSGSPGGDAAVGPASGWAAAAQGGGEGDGDDGDAPTSSICAQACTAQ